jgi:hypothetical protein
MPRGRPPKVKPMSEPVNEVVGSTDHPPAEDTLTGHPDFKAAVEKAAAQAVAKLLAESRKEHGTDSEASDPTWMRALAMEISQLTDQGTGRKRVAPEIIRSRQESHDRMVKLIIDARAAKKTATYKVKAKTHLADRVVEPFWVDNLHTAQPTIIDWDGIPNEAMVPENKTAKAIYDAYQGWIGSTVKVHPEDELAITPGGLVVHGAAAGISGGRRKLPGGAEAAQTGSPEPEGGLNVHHKNEPGRYVEKRILGSIAPPARQTV